MKKLFVLLLLATNAYADPLGSLRSASDVPLSTQTIRNQTTAQSATFNVSSGTATNFNTTTLKFNDATTMTTAATGDIEGVTAGYGLTGGGTSGTVTLNLNGATTSYIQNRSTLQSGTTAFPDFLQTGNTTTLGGQLRTPDGSATAPAHSFTNDTDVGLIRPSANAMSFIVGGSTAVVLSAAAEMTRPLQPAFLVTAPVNSTNVIGDNSPTTFTLEYDTEVFDQGSDFNNTSYTFTAPVTGRYLLSAAALVRDLNPANHTLVYLQLVTSNRSYFGPYLETGIPTGFLSVVVFGQVDMDANDTATILLRVGGNSQVCEIFDAAEYNYFSGSLIN